MQITDANAKTRPQVYVGLPTGNEKSPTPQFFPLLSLRDEGAAMIMAFCFSAITFSFNWLYAEALNARRNRGITHFLLLHADIVPESGFLRKMLAIMEDHPGCDVLSVVVPIKSNQGLTSTGFIPEGHDEWMVKRFTMKEVYDFPETFTHPTIVVNTGILLIDIRKPWAEQMKFSIGDKIERDASGGFIAKFLPEDWKFSVEARALGATIYATRGIKCEHIGIAKYNNHRVWGTEQTDPIWKNVIVGKKPE